MDRNSNRCANTEALARYERECEANERANDIKFEELKSECSEYITALNTVVEDNPDFATQLREFISDMI